MVNSIYIYHRLGLGDHIIFNGLIRDYVELYEKVFVFCKCRNYEQVKRMFMDNDQIEPFPFNDNDEIEYYIKRNPTLCIEILRPKPNKDDAFDKLTYVQSGKPFNYKWDKFFLKRNIENEDWVYRYFELENKEYIFVHQDIDRGYKINSKLLPDSHIVHSNAGSATIFDYLKVIENAKEIHCIDSCFLNLIDCIQLKTDGLYLHHYSRNSGRFATPTLKLDWFRYE